MSRHPNPNVQVGGATGVFAGSLKRYLGTVTIARLSNSESTSTLPVVTTRLLLKNLSGVLNIQIACGVVGTDPGGTPIRPALYPIAGAGTLQLTPINNYSDGSKVYLRPVFQNPALPQNQNNPLPQNIPFGWESSTECDEVEIEVVLTAAGWIGSSIVGNVVVQVTLEYNGQWWDVEAVQQSLTRVTLQGGPLTVPLINTLIG